MRGFINMKTERQNLGQAGEEAASRFLRKKGYKILGRNWRCRFGEIDIIALKQKGIILKKAEALIFVEVKTIDKSQAQFESQAEQNVNFFKQKHLIISAQSYIKSNNINLNLPWQIDVVAVEYDKDSNQHKIRHWENAVWGQQH